MAKASWETTCAETNAKLLNWGSGFTPGLSSPPIFHPCTWTRGERIALSLVSSVCRGGLATSLARLVFFFSWAFWLHLDFWNKAICPLLTERERHSSLGRLLVINCRCAQKPPTSIAPYRWVASSEDVFRDKGHLQTDCTEGRGDLLYTKTRLTFMAA